MFPFEKNVEHDKVYDKISALLNIKFKTQIQNGPIEFSKLLHVENLVTENKNYVLVFAHKSGSISFKEKDDFIENFMDYIDIKLEELQQEFDKLNNFQNMSMGIRYDENEVYMRHETIGDGQYKLGKLKKRLLKMKTVIKNSPLPPERKARKR